VEKKYKIAQIQENHCEYFVISVKVSRAMSDLSASPPVAN